MIYIVEKIEEDLDFGCEERDADNPVMAVVTLRSEDGEKTVRKFADQDLISAQIETGVRVYIDEEGKPRKALDSDWTKNCNPQTIDVQKFTDMMQMVKAGEHIEWKCPFCGGKVDLISQDMHLTLIGCGSCDMRIKLEN